MRTPGQYGKFKPGKRVAISVVLTGTLLCGAAISHFLLPPQVNKVELAQVQLPESGAHRMPAVMGLDQAIARQALIDANVQVPPVIKEAPFAAPIGSVVRQEPGPGDTNVAAVTLTVATPLMAPNVIGKEVSSARSELEALGALVSLEMVVGSGTAGTVVASDPAPGKAMTGAVALRVADEGVSAALSDAKRPVDTGCRTNSVSIDQGPTQDGYECTPSTTTPAELQVTLNGGASVFESAVGVRSAQSSGSSPGGAIGGPVTLTIFKDGQQARSMIVNPGAAQKFSLDVTQTRTLAFRITGNGASVLMFGSPTLRGTPSGMALVTS